MRALDATCVRAAWTTATRRSSFLPPGWHMHTLRSIRRVETELDALLLRIEAIALTCARELDSPHNVGDIAHDVLLDCLVRMRAGSWHVPPDDVGRFVRRMVQSRGRDLVRRRDRRDERERDYAHEVGQSARGWMAPGQMIDERELAEVHEQALAELPDRCRRVYVMVRDTQDTYAVIAKRLGISASAVSRHVVKAQRRLRNKFLASGFAAPPPRRGPPRRRNHCRPTHPSPPQS
jgi:RNA polymerase sigma factor (sigma-70 family)